MSCTSVLDWVDSHLPLLSQIVQTLDRDGRRPSSSGSLYICLINKVFIQKRRRRRRRRKEKKHQPTQILATLQVVSGAVGPNKKSMGSAIILGLSFTLFANKFGLDWLDWVDPFSLWALNFFCFQEMRTEWSDSLLNWNYGHLVFSKEKNFGIENNLI